MYYSKRKQCEEWCGKWKAIKRDIHTNPSRMCVTYSTSYLGCLLSAVYRLPFSICSIRTGSSKKIRCMCVCFHCVVWNVRIHWKCQTCLGSLIRTCAVKRHVNITSHFCCFPRTYTPCVRPKYSTSSTLFRYSPYCVSFKSKWIFGSWTSAGETKNGLFCERRLQKGRRE